MELSMSEVTVLVVAQHAVIGALLGSLVELAGHRVAFPEPAETISDAVHRVRPRLTLLDSDHPHSTDVRIAHEAKTIGSQLLLFSSSLNRHDTETIAASRHLPSFTLPIKFRDFVELIEHSVNCAVDRAVGTSGEHSASAAL
jgi:DNA-binding NtrC family response regulator